MININRKTLLSTWLPALLPIGLLGMPLLSISGCASSTKVAEPVQLAEQTETCAILESGKWHAWLDKYEQEEGFYRLNVVGEVTLPNPGFDLTWSVAPIDKGALMDKMSPSGLSLLLTATPREGVSIQVLSERIVDYKMSVPIAHYQHVSVYCATELLVNMPDVGLTD